MSGARSVRDRLPSGLARCTRARSHSLKAGLAATPAAFATLAAFAALTVLFPSPLQAQIRGVLVDAPQVGQRAPSLILPLVTNAGVASQPYELVKELGRTVILGFCVQLSDPGCTGFLRELEHADSSWGAGVSAVVVTGDPLGVAVAHAAATRGGGRILADERNVAGRRWGVPGGSSDRVGVFVVGWNGQVAYRDLQFSPDDLHARQRLWAAVQAIQQPPSAP